MAKISGPYAIPDEHVALIGRVAEAWASFEFEVDLGIWRLAETKQQLAACITAQFISIHPRLRAFTALVAVRGGSQQSIMDLKKFTGSVGDLSEKRNRSVHDPRYRDRATGDIHRLEITAKPNVQFGFIPEPKRELQETIGRIYAKTHEFVSLRDRIWNEIDTLPSESRPKFHQITSVQKSTQDRPSGS